MEYSKIYDSTTMEISTVLYSNLWYMVPGFGIFIGFDAFRELKGCFCGDIIAQNVNDFCRVR